MPKKVRIDMRELSDAFISGSDEMDNLLDLETGEIVLITYDDRQAVETFFDDADLAESEDPQAKFDAWLEDYECPEWQIESIRKAFDVEMSDERFVEIPKQDSDEGFDDMVEFAETVEDDNLKRLLGVALNGKGAFRRFKDVLDDFPEDKERWFKFGEEKLNERVLEWLEDEEIEVEK
jgi:hypothetical protein